MSSSGMSILTRPLARTQPSSLYILSQCRAYRSPFRSHYRGHNDPQSAEPPAYNATQNADNAFNAALSSNKKWCEHIAQEKPDLFPNLAKGQSPQILWLGCSDSRAPETTLLGLQPGDVFVHRNIANVFTPNDLSSAAAITFAVSALKVKHIVVCGHTSCGGVAATLGAASKGGVLDTWLAPLRRLRAQLEPGWEKEGTSAEERSKALIEANVREGLKAVRENAFVVDAIKSGALEVHGAVYDVGTGQLKELDTAEKEEDKGTREGVFALR